MPSEAPGKVTPRINRTMSMMKGNVAVMYTTWRQVVLVLLLFDLADFPDAVQRRLPTFPVDLTPFQMQKKQMTQTSSRHKARSHLMGPMSSIPLLMSNTLRLHREGHQRLTSEPQQHYLRDAIPTPKPSANPKLETERLPYPEHKQKSGPQS